MQRCLAAVPPDTICLVMYACSDFSSGRADVCLNRDNLRLGGGGGSLDPFQHSIRALICFVFSQANYSAMQRCLTAIAAAIPPNSSVLELYAGSGVIGLSLAAAGAAAKVVCVEINPLARQPFEASLAKLATSNKVSAGGEGGERGGCQPSFFELHGYNGVMSVLSSSRSSRKGCVCGDATCQLRLCTAS